MSKTLVIYKSKYGSTEKYAHWIAEDTRADIFKIGDVNLDTLLGYDVIVFCGGLYAGGLLGFSLIKKNYGKLLQKKIIVVAVGATQKKEAAIREVKANNLTREMQDSIPFFLLRGGLNYKRMNLLDKTLMYLLVKSLKAKKPDKLNDDAKGMIATYGKVIDFTDRNAIAPIVREILDSKSNILISG